MFCRCIRRHTLAPVARYHIAMIDDDLRMRSGRLLAGQWRVDDLDRLFLGQRDRHHGKESFREIGDFVAHRAERQKGLVTQVARDVLTSVSVWSLGFRNKKAENSDIVRAARANFRLASDQQLKDGCGLRRHVVKRRLDSGLAKFERGETVTDEELNVLLYLGNRFIWKPAFSDDQLFAEFCDVLRKNLIIYAQDIGALENARAFIALYAITCMHGSVIQFDGDMRAELLAGFANRDRLLEVKVQIRFDDMPKPILAPICMFLTSLQPDAYCEPALLSFQGEWLLDVWSKPIEINAYGKLDFIG
jgi:hypothetical protein